MVWHIDVKVYKGRAPYDCPNEVRSACCAVSWSVVVKSFCVMLIQFEGIRRSVTKLCQSLLPCKNRYRTRVLVSQIIPISAQTRKSIDLIIPHKYNEIAGTRSASCATAIMRTLRKILQHLHANHSAHQVRPLPTPNHSLASKHGRLFHYTACHACQEWHAALKFINTCHSGWSDMLILHAAPTYVRYCLMTLDPGHLLKLSKRIPLCLGWHQLPSASHIL